MGRSDRAPPETQGPAYAADRRCGRQHGKASERLALSQPAISKAISDMEKILGAPLFDRLSSGVELTDCGRVLVERARVIFDEVRQGVLDIEHMSDPTRGEVRIGTIEPFTGVVAEIISQLVRRYPVSATTLW